MLTGLGSTPNGTGSRGRLVHDLNPRVFAAKAKGVAPPQDRYIDLSSVSIET
jgi:hypothetical protein